MAAGDLISTVPYQWELRSYLFGTGRPCYNDSTGFTGWTSVGIKSVDSNRSFEDGSVATADLNGVRTIMFNLLIVYPGNEALAMQEYINLVTAWSRSAVDIPLYGYLPYLGKVHVSGRPRGLAEDMSRLWRGVIRAQATFVALDPTIH